MRNLLFFVIGVLTVASKSFCQTAVYSNLLPVTVSPQRALSNKIALNISDSSRKGAIETESKVRNVPPPSTSIAKDIPDSQKYFSLIIGVSEYQFSDEKLHDLENPTIDASSLSNTLRNYCFSDENTHLLLNPSRAEIIDKLDQLSRLITDKDNFLIFYAGHGFWDNHLNVGYWLPSDAQLEKKSTWLSNSSLKDYIAGIKAKHTLLISDACFSGSLFKAREVTDPLSNYGVAKLYRLPSRKAMTSGNLSITPDRSRFFEFLNKRLTQNDQEYLSSRELFYSLYNAVINNTSTVPQYGVIQDTGDEGGDFIFIRKK